MTSLAPARVTRLAGVSALALMVVLTLSACLKLDATMTIDSDAKATGTLAIAFQKQAASFLGISSLSEFEKGLNGGDLGGDQLASLGDCATSETDADYVYTCTFADASFTDANAGPWTITKDGNSIVMRIVNEGQSSQDAGALLGDASLGSLTVTATFPGPITEITGAGATKTSDSTAQIEASLTDPVDVTVRSDASGSGFLAVLLTVIIAIVVLGVIILVAIILIMRRRRRRTQVADETVEPGGADEAAASTPPDAPTTDAPSAEEPPTA